MKYEIEHWNNRTVFVFNESAKTFDDFLKIIDEQIGPDSKTEREITSWTESVTFSKNGVNVYFENLYANEKPIHSFELFPLGKHNETDFAILKKMMDNLDDHDSSIDK